MTSWLSTSFPLFGREESYYSDGVWYDAENRHMNADLPHYQWVAEQHAGESLLELCAGTGRITLPMARYGARVLAVDNAQSMLDVLEKKLAQEKEELRSRVRYTFSDARYLDLKERFSAVVLGFNSLMHFVEDADFEALLLGVHAHLLPHGLFYFDLQMPAIPAREYKPDDRFDPIPMIDPRSGERYIVSENNRYDARKQLYELGYYYRKLDEQGEPFGPERQVILTLRLFFPRELDSWLSRCGFAIQEEWSSFERNRPFTGKEGRRIIVAKAL